MATQNDENQLFSNLNKKIDEIRNISETDLYEAFNLHLNEIFEEYSIESKKEDIFKNVYVKKRIEELNMLKYLIKIPIFIAEKIFKAFSLRSKDGLTLDCFSEPLNTLKYGTEKEVLQIIFKLLDFNSSGVISYQNIKIFTSMIPFKNNNNFSSFHYQQQSLDTLDKILQPFFQLQKINFNEFTNIIINNINENIFLLIFSFLYENIPVFRKPLEIYNVKHRRHSMITVSTNAKTNSNKSLQYNFANIGNFANVNNHDGSSSIGPRRKHYRVLEGYKNVQNVIPLEIRKAKNKFLDNYIQDLKSKDKKKKEEPIEQDEEDEDEIEFDMDRSFNSIRSDREGEETKKKNSDKVKMDSKFKNKVLGHDPVIEDDDIDTNFGNLFIHEHSQNEEIFLKDLEKVNKSIILEGELLVLENKTDFKTQYTVLIDKNLYFYNIKEEKDFRDKYHTTRYLLGCFVRANKPEIINGESLSSFTLFYQNEITNTFYHRDSNMNCLWVKTIRDSIDYRNVFDSYKLFSQIAEGSFGRVFYSKEITTGKEFAIKILDKETNKHNNWQAIKGEIDIMKIANHPRIVKYIDNFENSAFSFIVMEYLKHGSLNSYLIKKHFKLKERTIASIAFQTAISLQYLHRFGIIHRDLKPDNILISNIQGNDIEVKLTDFGFGKILGEKENAKEKCGTLAFSAPELLSSKPYDFSVDVWSLGINIFYMITGDVPFKKSKDRKDYLFDVCNSEVKFPSKFFHISDDAKELILRCLVKDPLKRITTDEFVNHAWVKEFKDSKNI